MDTYLIQVADDGGFVLSYQIQAIKSLYHDGLLDQGIAVLTHILQDLVGSIVAGCGGGLGGHS